jgi:hypothetical protein
VFGRADLSKASLLRQAGPMADGASDGSGCTVGHGAAAIKQQAGHITDKMSRHYTHISEAARRRWMEVAHQSRWARRQTPLAQAERFVAHMGFRPS